MSTPRALILAPIAIGALWGLGTPLTKLAVTGGWQPLGVLVWQAVVMIVAGAIAVILRGRPMPRGPRAWATCAMVALIGTLLPQAAIWRALQDLPAGVMAIVVSLTPLLSLPLAVAMGLDRATLPRVAGVALGTAGVATIAASAMGLGGGALSLAGLAIALVAPACFALNGNLLDRLDRGGLDPFQLVLGSALLALPTALLLATATGQLRLPTTAPPDLAMLGATLIHAAAYTALLWVIGQGGAVFAALTNPFITGFGVLWSMALLAERYPAPVWIGLALILAGLALVRPRDRTLLPKA
jgi:drug/metabolite transporter (DMT)-like permease